jgi:polyketide cyclase/dehydrase/lipid transport protein
MALPGLGVLSVLATTTNYLGGICMPIIKLALITSLALLIGSGSAYAITVEKKRDAPGDPAEVWAVIGDFCAIKDWHPVVEQCEETKEGDVTFRTLTLKDGGKIKEKLTGTKETSYSYEIVESPLPVKNYKATLSVEEDEDTPERSEVHWEANFDAQGASEDDAKKTIADIFEAGVKGIKKAAIEAWDKKHPDEAKKDDDDDDDK